MAYTLVLPELTAGQAWRMTTYRGRFGAGNLRRGLQDTSCARGLALSAVNPAPSCLD